MVPHATARLPRAEALGARLPPLIVAAERVAATVRAGVHGRRRPGHGDAFWQFRPFAQGDAAARVDWRQSARGDRLFVRETESEAAQTVALWCANDAGMGWRGAPSRPSKRERAELLLLALAALLIRGGERVRMLGAGRTLAGRGALERLAQDLDHVAGPPEDPALPRHARIVLFADFWAPLEAWQQRLSALSTRGLRGTLVQVLDPAEETLPYAGRVRFEGLAGEAPELMPRVEGVRAAYAGRVAAHRDGLATLARSNGCTLMTHHTDQPPESALLALWLSLSGEAG